MRQSNKNNNLLYNGKLDVGGNSQRHLTAKYFKPFNDSKNLQLHGKLPSPNNNFVGGYSYEPFKK